VLHPEQNGKLTSANFCSGQQMGNDYQNISDLAQNVTDAQSAKSKAMTPLLNRKLRTL
jgi:hypothetical protein